MSTTITDTGQFSAAALEELSRGHGEPPWALARRQHALSIFERMDPPSRQDEEWRRTDVSRLDLRGLRPTEAAGAVTAAVAPDGVAGFIHQVGSETVVCTLDPALAAQGVVFMPLTAALGEHAGIIEPRLFTLVTAERDRFAALHAAFFAGGAFLYVPDGVTVERPIVSRYESMTGGTAVLPHTLVVAGEGSRVNYLDEYVSPASEPMGFKSGSAEVFAGAGSETTYVSIQKWGRSAWQISNQSVHLERDATVRLFDVAIGGHFTKVRVEATMAGPGAKAELKGVYFGSDDQFFDFHTLQDHAHGGGTSDLLFKGALRDSARSVYAGLIRIAKGAARSDAYQANRNLVLSAAAKATSIPMLEIDNNDVRCTHGATVGPVDEQHLFYLVSRGIPRPTAERMVVLGFFGEVLDRIPLEEARALIEEELEARIG